MVLWMLDPDFRCSAGVMDPTPQPGARGILLGVLESCLGSLRHIN